MPESRTSLPQMPRTNSVQLKCLLFAMVVATSTVSAFSKGKRQYFTACSGWGPSCASHSAEGRDVAPIIRISKPSHSLRRENLTPRRTHSGIPSIVTSGGWEPGTMGKRTLESLYAKDLLKILRSAREERADNN